jgi:hypothetical protein
VHTKGVQANLEFLRAQKWTPSTPPFDNKWVLDFKVTPHCEVVQFSILRRDLASNHLFKLFIGTANNSCVNLAETWMLVLAWQVLTTVVHKQKQQHHALFVRQIHLSLLPPSSCLYADALARKSITNYSDVVDTSIETAGPEGNPFSNIYWLANEYKNNRIMQNHPNTAQWPTSRLWYLSNYLDALQAHMHPLHKLGNANTIANYHEYYQTLIKNGNANGAASKCLPNSILCPCLKQMHPYEVQNRNPVQPKACGMV